MNKYLYAILRLKTTSWIKYWLYNKSMKTKGVLSNILEGISFYLTDSLNRKFNLFQIIGRSMQEGTPTPENPVEIKNTGDNGFVNEKVQNKNLFDIEEAVKRFENWAGDLRSDWGTYENGVVNIVKSNGAHGYYGFAGQKFAFNKGASCTLSAEVLLEGTNSASGLRIGVEERKKDNTPIGSAKNIDIAKNKWTHITLIVSFTEAVTNARVQIEAANTGNTVQIKNIQLEQGTTATEYQAHEEQNISFPLAQGQKFMEGDYLADDGVHHVMAQVDLSTLNWTSYATNKYTTNELKDIIKIPESVYTIPVLFATKYKAVTQAGTLVNGNIAISSAGALTICNETGTPTGIAQYPLKQEVIDPYTSEQQTAWEQIKALRTYKGGTHISSEDELPANLKIQYWKEE